MKLRDRIGVDLGRKIRLEAGIEWAAKNGVRFIDVQLDTAENALPTLDAKRCAPVRRRCGRAASSFARRGAQAAARFFVAAAAGCDAR